MKPKIKANNEREITMSQRAKFATKKFPWEQIADDDFICRPQSHNGKEYVLRVEQMDKQCWWTQVYYGDDELFFENNFVQSKKHAIGLAEGAYMGHTSFSI